MLTLQLWLLVQDGIQSFLFDGDFRLFEAESEQRSSIMCVCVCVRVCVCVCVCEFTGAGTVKYF